MNFAGDLAASKPARHLSTYISPAHAALDGNSNTAACTQATAGHPWWSVDLGQNYDIRGVAVTFPSSNDNLCNYLRSCVIH